MKYQRGHRRKRNRVRRFVRLRDFRVWRSIAIIPFLLLGAIIGIALGTREPSPASHVEKQLAGKALAPKHASQPRVIATPQSPGASPHLPKVSQEEEPHLPYEETFGPSSAKSAVQGAEEERERRPVLLGSVPVLALKPFGRPKPLWLQNASAMPDIRGRPMIALVIDDVGVDRKRSLRAMHLPGSVTLSFLPYALEVQREAQQARALGHEIMVHVPMEPESPDVDPGPNALRVTDSPTEIQRRLDWDLGRFSGYVAVNNHMGSKFTRDPEGMRIVLDTIKARGIFFLDSRTTSTTVGLHLAEILGVPHLGRDVFLDNVETREEVSTRLAEVERVARRYGYGIAIGHPHDATLDVLEKWTREIEERGFVLVPISTVMRVRLATDQARQRAQAGG